MIKFFRLFLIFSIIMSCTQIPKNSVVKGSIKKCDDIFKERALEEDLMIHKSLLNGLGNLTSYTLSGAGYVGDLVVFLASGVAVPLVLCSPTYPLLRAPSAGELVVRCWGYVGHKSYTGTKKLVGGYLGENIYNSTEPLRCPDIEWLKVALNDVASCYRENGDMNLYNEQVNLIKSNKLLNTCQ